MSPLERCDICGFCINDYKCSKLVIAAPTQGTFGSVIFFLELHHFRIEMQILQLHGNRTKPVINNRNLLLHGSTVQSRRVVLVNQPPEVLSFPKMTKPTSYVSIV